MYSLCTLECEVQSYKKQAVWGKRQCEPGKKGAINLGQVTSYRQIETKIMLTFLASRIVGNRVVEREPAL